jgi:FOG: Ankyrin repeat
MLIALNNPEISGRLCAHGASPSILLPDGKSLLQKTIDGRDVQLAEFLLARGAKFCSYKDGSECLASAVRLYENEEAIGHLDPNYLINEKKCRIFILRLLNQDRPHNHILLSMETEAAHNASPLYFAIQRNFPLIVSAMLACVDQTKRQQIIENALLIPQEGYPEPMANHIAYDEYAEIWKQLLPLSTAIINYKDADNRTPIMIALHSGPKGDILAKLLLEQGAQVNIQDTNGATPLRLAFSRGTCDEVKRLIHQRIPLDQVNLQELITLITLKDDVKMLQSMAESDINSIHKKVLFNELKVTILELAALSDAKQCLKYLLDNREKLKISAEELASSFVLILTFKTTNDEEHERQRTDQLITMFLDTGAVPPTMPVNIQIPCDLKEGDMIPVLVTPIDQLILSHPILNHNIIQYIRRLLQQENPSYDLNYTCIYQSKTRTSQCELHDSPCTLCIKSCPPAIAIEVLQLLIEHGANIDYVPEGGYGPAIFSAVARGYSPLIDLCLKYNANVNVFTKDCSTLLHLLTIKTPEESDGGLVDRFIKLGIDINHQDNQGRTALHIAFQTKNKHMIYKLIDLGCKTDITDVHGKKAFDYFPINQALLAAAQAIKAIKPAAKKSTHKKSAHLPTVVGPDPKDELVLAIKSGSLETVQKLITQENINTPIDSKGNTPLTLATTHAQLDCMDYLVVHGASATQTNTAGQTAWTIALQYTQDNPAIVTTLLKNFRNEHIARADNIDANGNSILHYAVLTENYSALDLVHRNFFKEIRQYIDCYNADGDTPLIVAIKRQCIPLIAILINQYNADLNTPSKDSLAPLLNALKANNVELAQLLLNRGANPTCTDRAGNTALHYAAIYATQDRIIDLLIERGCDLAATNALGERPAEITSLEGKKSTARIKSYVAKCSDEKLRNRPG